MTTSVIGTWIGSGRVKNILATISSLFGLGDSAILARISALLVRDDPRSADSEGFESDGDSEV